MQKQLLHTRCNGHWLFDSFFHPRLVGLLRFCFSSILGSHYFFRRWHALVKDGGTEVHHLRDKVSKSGVSPVARDTQCVASLGLVHEPHQGSADLLVVVQYRSRKKVLFVSFFLIQGIRMIGRLSVHPGVVLLTATLHPHPSHPAKEHRNKQLTCTPI